MRVLKAPVLKPFSGILGKVGKTKEAVKNCLKMVRVTGLEPAHREAQEPNGNVTLVEVWSIAHRTNNTILLFYITL
jgi:hypothetical protein